MSPTPRGVIAEPSSLPELWETPPPHRFTHSPPGAPSWGPGWAGSPHAAHAHAHLSRLGAHTMAKLRACMLVWALKEAMCTK